MKLSFLFEGNTTASKKSVCCLRHMVGLHHKPPMISSFLSHLSVLFWNKRLIQNMATCYITFF